MAALSSLLTLSGLLALALAAPQASLHSRQDCGSGSISLNELSVSAAVDPGQSAPAQAVSIKIRACNQAEFSCHSQQSAAVPLVDGAAQVVCDATTPSWSGFVASPGQAAASPTNAQLTLNMRREDGLSFVYNISNLFDDGAEHSPSLDCGGATGAELPFTCAKSLSNGPISVPPVRD